MNLNDRDKLLIFRIIHSHLQSVLKCITVCCEMLKKMTVLKSKTSENEKLEAIETGIVLK